MGSLLKNWIEIDGGICAASRAMTCVAFVKAARILVALNGATGQNFCPYYLAST